ncbi:MAG TPA: DUF2513 domain-containing protein [Gemmataceae bacterium]|jgi:hypothetical protein
MQRNMDLVRSILMWIEDSPSGWTVPSFGIATFTSEQMSYHARIMMEDGLVERAGPTRSGDPVYSLTWKGHELLDAARDQKRWNQAKIAIGKVGSAPISVWTKILQDLVLKELGVAS